MLQHRCKFITTHKCIKRNLNDNVFKTESDCLICHDDNKANNNLSVGALCARSHFQLMLGNVASSLGGDHNIVIHNV